MTSTGQLSIFDIIPATHYTSIKGNFFVNEIPYSLAMETVIKHHYLHRKCPCSHAYGLFDNSGRLMGCIVYGVPPSSTLLKGICGEDEMHNVYELNRLWVSDDVPKNGESFLIGNTIKLLDKEIIVSFADTSHNHIGYVYQATNFLYCGLSARFVDPKVKGFENMHHATYAHGMTMKQVKEKYGEENVYYVERPRKHRYIYFNAKGKRKQQLLNKLKYKVLPYPKGGGEKWQVDTITE